MEGEMLAALVGVLVGVITGIIPGLHPNNVAVMSVGLAAVYNPFLVAVFLVSAGVVNSFVTFIPSILLGAPEDDSVLSVLPGHRLLLQGRGFEAVYLSVIGGMGATMLSLLSLPVFWFVVPQIYSIIRPHTHWLLIFVSSYMIFREKQNKKIWAFVVFLLAGIMGMLSIKHAGSSSLFPLLTGLFALPMLRQSYKHKIVIPEISFKVEKLKKMFIIRSVLIGSLAGILAGLLPGIGSSQAAIIAQEATGMKATKNNTKSFLISLGGINTADIIYSLFAILLIGNPRSGIAVAVSKIVNLDINKIMILCIVVLISSLISSFLTLKLTKVLINFIKKINYSALSKFVFYCLLFMILLFSGVSGILIALPSMLIGHLPQRFGIMRTHLMGCLIIPTILFFLSM